ncbi:hypothetical protein SAMCFNEI73_Ch1523 [Sinorhizobium americanum]|uniref:Uncharacterized protein n=1 Tax=Sinorhizobium americanum TaxID=194963 RepID=A0A1L3LL68_9HYPH|nr:hypothetical protein SAMCFNEI73_Ch1523 [Sinorhizobium americanum]
MASSILGLRRRSIGPELMCGCRRELLLRHSLAVSVKKEL